MEFAGRTFSSPARQLPHPTTIQTTLYDLIAALSDAIPLDDDDLLTATVVHFLNTHRVTYTGPLAGYRLVCDAGERGLAWARLEDADLASSADPREGA
jgi:hypothetical protein